MLYFDHFWEPQSPEPMAHWVQLLELHHLRLMVPWVHSKSLWGMQPLAPKVQLAHWRRWQAREWTAHLDLFGELQLLEPMAHLKHLCLPLAQKQVPTGHLEHSWELCAVAVKAQSQH
jgi:hypothetical protein